MKDIIQVILNEDHEFQCDVKTIGRDNENKITQLEIKLDENLCDYWFYLDFKKPDGTKFKTSELDIIEGTVNYVIPNTLLKQGVLKVQAVLQKENNEIWKSTIHEFGVNSSINATDEIIEQKDFVSEAQKLLNNIEAGLTPTIGENDNWFILDKDTGKTSRGEKGEKGEKGDPGAIKFIVVIELPTENIDESAIYMLPTNANDSNAYEEYIYVNGSWEVIGAAQVKVDLSNYVEKEEDKGLSTNDYTDDDKTKVDGIITSGDGNSYLANDGNYKEVSVKQDIYVGYCGFSFSSTNGSTKITDTTRLATIKNIIQNAMDSGASTIILRPTADFNQNFTMISIGRNIQMYKNGTTSAQLIFIDTNLDNENNRLKINSKRVMVTYNVSTDGIVSVTNAIVYGLSSDGLSQVLHTTNTSSYTPTANYHPATKKYVDDLPKTYTGYDATKTQVLKNINGTLTWEDAE